MKHSFSSYILIPILAAGGLLSGLAGCKQELTPLDKDGPAPGAVSNVRVENLPGSALLTYDLPAGQDVWYVKAEYEIRPGVPREKKSSYYTNQLLLDGFGASREHEVTLYAVSRNEKESEPVTVSVQPETPPIKEIYQSLSLTEAFGGITLRMENKAETELVLFVITTDSLGNWIPVETYYTSKKEDVFSARGFEAEKRRFGVYLRDRWENYSDTLVRELTPYFEEELDKNKFEELRLPTDTWEQRYSSSPGIPGIWDGDRSGSGNGHNYQSVLPTAIPLWFTFDLGVTAKFSRMKYWMKNGLFNSGNMKQFEIWGSTAPDSDGSWNSWTLLATFESKKPSGLPGSELTQEDRAYAEAGEDFIFPEDAPAIRYIRLKALNTWNPSSQNVWVNEISFWGDIE